MVWVHNLVLHMLIISGSNELVNDLFLYVCTGTCCYWVSPSFVYLIASYLF